MSEPKTVPTDVQGLAYVLLFAQQQQFNPGLTPDQFKAWLRSTVGAIATTAKKGK